MIVTGIAWVNEEKDGLIEISRCGGSYCGRIVWTKEPNYPPDDRKGRAGQPRLDDNNPDSKLREQPIVGLQIMTGFAAEGRHRWRHGTVYDPKNGKTYSGTITLVPPDTLELRGYVLLPLFGRTTTWTRQNR